MHESEILVAQETDRMDKKALQRLNLITRKLVVSWYYIFKVKKVKVPSPDGMHNLSIRAPCTDTYL